jgi:FKBP-type peptidyl-prolyl cis-trans isomerase
LLDFVEHSKAPARNRSPSHVVRVTGSDENPELRDLYMNLGDPLSGSSVAVHHDGLLFIGAVFDKAVLRCIGKRVK